MFHTERERKWRFDHRSQQFLHCLCARVMMALMMVMPEVGMTRMAVGEMKLLLLLEVEAGETQHKQRM